MQDGDRRLNHHQQAALNCPRCDSLNTKFCYYNNYNLSQPRYFCKNCRRYWTKGGVLRNVPVGGGCRKAKRSKPKLKPPPSSHSSSDSSSAVIRLPESENRRQIGNNMFTSEIGGFANLLNNSGDPLGLSGAAETTTAAFSQFLQSDGAAMLDPTVRIDDLMENRESNGDVVALNWEVGTGTCTSTGLFDLLLPSSGVDHQYHDHQSEYWSQTASSHPDQWSCNTNSDLPLFLP